MKIFTFHEQFSKKKNLACEILGVQKEFIEGHLT